MLFLFTLAETFRFVCCFLRSLPFSIHYTRSIPFPFLQVCTGTWRKPWSRQSGLESLWLVSLETQGRGAGVEVVVIMRCWVSSKNGTTEKGEERRGNVGWWWWYVSWWPYEYLINSYKKVMNIVNIIYIYVCIMHLCIMKQGSTLTQVALQSQSFYKVLKTPLWR